MIPRYGWEPLTVTLESGEQKHIWEYIVEPRRPAKVDPKNLLEKPVHMTSEVMPTCVLVGGSFLISCARERVRNGK